MADDEVTRNLKGMDELDFAGWNSADWHGVFARNHSDDVLIDVHGQGQTHGIQEHIDAGVRRDHRWHAHPDHIAPDQIRIRRVDVRGRKVRRWWPDGDRREMARWRNRRGVHLDVASAATLWPGWVSSGELGGGTFEGTSRSNRIRARADGVEVHHLTGRDRGQSSSASPSGPSRLLWNCFACIRVPAWERDIDPRHLRDHVPCPVKQMTAAKSPIPCSIVSEVAVAMMRAYCPVQRG
jgi:hypothetical protein